MSAVDESVIKGGVEPHDATRLYDTIFHHGLISHGTGCQEYGHTGVGDQGNIGCVESQTTNTRDHCTTKGVLGHSGPSHV